MLRYAAAGALLFLLTVVGSALTTANTVPVTRLVNDVRPIKANDLKPSNCSAITVTTLRTGSGVISGTGAAELILGGASGQLISGAGGSDCILGGDGDDTIDGGTGTDVCLGGPGTDVIVCETMVP